MGSLRVSFPFGFRILAISASSVLLCTNVEGKATPDKATSKDESEWAAAKTNNIILFASNLSHLFHYKHKKHYTFIYLHNLHHGKKEKQVIKKIMARNSITDIIFSFTDNVHKEGLGLTL